MASTTKDLGRVMPVAQGAYSTTKTYVPLDIVTYNGSSYVCLATNTGKAPTDMTYWQSLAMRGSDGPVGPAGKDGATGPAGATGPQGIQGVKGDIGPVGPKGDKGDTGATGPQGPVGPNGLSAYQVASVAGYTGTETQWLASLKGAQGPQGLTGAKGDTGAQGPQGPQGIQGPKGDTGPQGIHGPIGKTGATGSTGPQGAQGVKGPQGAQGVKGDTGPTGPQGPQGPAGKDSASMIIDNGSNTTNGRAVNCTPAYYQTNYPAKEVKEFKQTANIGLSLISGQTSSYCILTTRVPGTNTGFGWARQIAETTSSTRPLTYVRIGTSDTVWSAWELMTTW